MQNSFRIRIAADWTAEEFAQLYKSANSLYLFFALDSDEARSLNEIVGRHERNLEEALQRLDRGAGLEFALGEIAGRLAASRDHRRFAPSSAVLDLFRGSMRDFAKARYFDDPAALAEVLAVSTDDTEWANASAERLLTSGNWRSRLRIRGSREILVSDKVRVARELVVLRTEHNSPGFTDLAGIGQIIGHLKEFLIKLVDFYAGKEERNLKNSKLRYENEMAALEVIERKLEIMERAGCDSRSLQQVAAEIAPHINFFTEATNRGLITHVEDISSDG